MKIATTTEMKTHFNAYLKAIEDGPVILKRKGKPSVVILSVEDEDELDRLILAYSPKFQNILRTARQQIEDTGGIAHEDFWNELETEKNSSL